MNSTSRRRFLKGAALGTGCLLVAPATVAQVTLPRAPAGTIRAWNAVERIPIWRGSLPSAGTFRAGAPMGAPDYVNGIVSPELHVVRPTRPNGRAVLILPGGGYFIMAVITEGFDVAHRLAAAGYTAFVLTYRLPNEGWADRADVPLQDAQRAMRVIRARARAFGCDPAKVAVLGFSAGGHLAASLATGFDETVYPPRDANDRLNARPAAAGLIYPVITMAGPSAHAFSAAMLLGPHPDAVTVARRSPAQHVTADTPPVFLAQAVDDTTVSVQNSIVMLDALRAAHRPVEAHFFAEGGHGFGLGSPASAASEWPNLFERWLGRQLA